MKATKGYELEITVLLSPEEFSIAASRVNDLSNIAKADKYSAQQLADYNDFIDTIISIIEHHEFDIVNEEQSGHSYAYYVEFYPTDEYGERWNDFIKIKFRLADHENAGADNQDRRRGSRSKGPKPETYIMSFLIGSKKYPTAGSVIRRVREICNHLDYGDYSDFTQD